MIVGINGAEGKNVTITNIAEGDGFVTVTFSASLERGAACSAGYRNALAIEGNNSQLAREAKRAFSLGRAVNVWAAGACTKVSDYETASVIEIVK